MKLRQFGTLSVMELRLKLIKMSAKCQRKQVCNFQMKIEITGENPSCTRGELPTFLNANYWPRTAKKLGPHQVLVVYCHTL